MRVLVVEDDEEVRTVLSCRLQSWGFDVVMAADGPQGLETARRVAPDLIILDLMLPSLPGEGVCRAIREDDNHTFAKTPILMLTAKASETDRIIGKVIGATSYLSKPYSSQELFEEIRRSISAPLQQNS